MHHSVRGEKTVVTTAVTVIMATVAVPGVTVIILFAFQNKAVFANNFIDGLPNIYAY